MGERSHDVRPEPVVDGGPAMVEHILHLLHILHTPGRKHLAHLVRFCTSGTSAHFACLQTMGYLRNTLFHCSNAFGLVTPCEILHQKTAQYLLPFGVCQRMPGSCQKAEKSNCGMLRKYCWLVSFKGVLIRLIFNLPDFPQIDQLLSLPMSRQHH